MLSIRELKQARINLNYRKEVFTSMFNENFYPTPRMLVFKMLGKLGDLRQYSTFLEPSGGKGDLLDVLSDNLRIYNKNKKLDIDTIEIDKDLQHILKGKNYRLVHDDFLTYNSHKKYDVIIGNVPFSDGDKHILKMIEIQERLGGKIVVICNSETIKNQYSNTRKLLGQKLEYYNASIEYIQDAFKGQEVERQTGVEIALIYIDIPSNGNSLILDNLKQEEEHKAEYNNTYDVVDGDYLTGIIQQYQVECKAAVKFINEYSKIKDLVKESFESTAYSIFDLRVDRSSRGLDAPQELINEAVRKIRYKYWKTLFNSNEVSKLLTGDLRTQWYAKLDDLKDYDFSEFNIVNIKYEMSKGLVTGIKQTILDLFDDFTYKYSTDNAKNIHYFNGWRTNKAYKLGNKVILPLNCYCSYTGSLEFDYRVRDKLRDIHRAFEYLDNGNTLVVDNVDEILQIARDYGETKEIQFAFFTLNVFKKGTVHLVFKDEHEDILEKFNIFCCKEKGFLGNEFGKKRYSDMTKEEKQVVKEYCGETKYQEIYSNQEYYNFNENNIKLIAG